MSEQLVVKCPKHLNITLIDSFHEEMIEHLHLAHELVLDLSDVEKMDTTGCQLLLSAQQAVVSKGGTLAIKNIADSAMDVMNTLGLVDHFTIVN